MLRCFLAAALLLVGSTCGLAQATDSTELPLPPETNAPGAPAPVPAPAPPPTPARPDAEPKAATRPPQANFDLALARQAARMMEGDYNSARQAAADKEYFDIRLHIRRIWKDRRESEGIYFYVEQATAAAQQKPYRQRVYQLRARPDGRVESVVYSLKNPLRFAGQWKLDKPLASLTPDSLEERKGCAVILRKHSSREIRGATEGQDCPSDLRGARYATTEVIITPKQFVSWDRGFDEKGQQVWGAKYGGYVFEKETASNPPPKVK